MHGTDEVLNPTKLVRCPNGETAIRAAGRSRLAAAFAVRRVSRALATLGGLGIAVLALYPVAVVLALAAGILLFASRHGPI